MWFFATLEQRLLVADCLPIVLWHRPQFVAVPVLSYWGQQSCNEYYSTSPPLSGPEQFLKGLFLWPLTSKRVNCCGSEFNICYLNKWPWFHAGSHSQPCLSDMRYSYLLMILFISVILHLVEDWVIFSASIQMLTGSVQLSLFGRKPRSAYHAGFKYSKTYVPPIPSLKK